MAQPLDSWRISQDAIPPRRPYSPLGIMNCNNIMTTNEITLQESALVINNTWESGDWTIGGSHRRD